MRYSTLLAWLVAPLLLAQQASATSILGDFIFGSGDGPAARLYANLPTCNSATKGKLYGVKDCNTSACTAGGGTVAQELICDGAAWVVQGDGTAEPGAVGFADVGSGANANALQITTGGSLAAIGTGTIAATSSDSLGSSSLDVRWDNTAKCWYADASGNGALTTSDVNEQCIDGIASATSSPQGGRRMVCNPATYESGSASDGVQECITKLEAIGGGVVQLGPRFYDITNDTPITIGTVAAEITIQGAGQGVTFITCTTANGCTAPAVFDVMGDNVKILSLSIEADLDSQQCDGIRIGGSNQSDCTDTLIPSHCCEGTGTGCTGGNPATYPTNTVIRDVLIDGDAGDLTGNDCTSACQFVGIRHYGLQLQLENVTTRRFNAGLLLSGKSNPAGASNVTKVVNSQFRNSNTGILTTSGKFGTGFADWDVLTVIGSTFEHDKSAGITLTGYYANAGHHPVATVQGSWFEIVGIGINLDGITGTDDVDTNLVSIGNLFTQTTTDAIVADSASGSVITSINDSLDSTNCIQHNGTAGRVNYVMKNAHDNTCTPTVSATVQLADDDSRPQVLQLTDCTGATADGNAGDFCQDTDNNTLYVCETSPKCIDGAGWFSYGGGGSGAFSDAADPVVLNTTTKDVVIGAAQKNTSKVTVDGDADQVQMTIQGHSTQTTNLLTIEKSDGTDLLTLDNNGNLTLASTGGVNVPGNTTAGQTIAAYEDSDNGTNQTGFKAPDTLAADVIYTAPTTGGTNGYQLTTDGGSPPALSWSAHTDSDCQVLYKSTGSIADTEDITSVFRAPYALTITEVWCETDTGTANVDVQIDDGTPADVMGTDLVCDTTGEVDNAGLTGSMAAGNTLDWAITSVASSPARLTVCVKYTY